MAGDSLVCLQVSLWTYFSSIEWRADFTVVFLPGQIVGKERKEKEKRKEWSCQVLATLTMGIFPSSSEGNLNFTTSWGSCDKPHIFNWRKSGNVDEAISNHVFLSMGIIVKKKKNC